MFGGFAGFEVEVYSEDNDQTVTVTIIKEDESIYSYNVEVKVSGTKMDIMNGKIETEKETDSKDEQKGKTTISMTIPETGTIKLDIDYSAVYNQGIDAIDTQNNVNMNDLTEEDMQGIMEKLMERPLIGSLIQNQMSSTGTDNITDGTDNFSNTTTTTSQNQVKEYGYLVTYTVPAGFEYDSDYSHDYKKYYSRDNGNSVIDVTTEVQWYTEDEYREDIQWDYDYYTDSTYYQNVNLGEVRTLNVGGNEFKYQILTYDSNSEYYSENYQSAYIWYRLSDEYIFTVEIETTNTEITEDLISSFLNIQVSQVNE